MSTMKRFLTSNLTMNENAIVIKKPKPNVESPDIEVTTDIEYSEGDDEIFLSEQDRNQCISSKFGQWYTYGTILYKFADPTNLSNDPRINYQRDQKKSFRMIGFDMDGTLIKNKSGRVFSLPEKYLTDWTLWDSSIPEKLSEMIDNNTTLAIISNQSGVGKQITIEQLKSKVDAVLSSLKVPIDFICCVGNDLFRKPRTAMWQFLSLYHRSNSFSDKPLDRMSSFYVGDAAGRPQEGTRKEDFSDSDLKFARNLGLNFFTPEKFFLRSTQRLHCQLSTPSGVILRSVNRDKAPIDPKVFILSEDHPQEVVLMVAPVARLITYFVIIIV